MKHLHALLVLMAACAGQARADYLNWTYSANASVNAVAVSPSPQSGGATVSFADYNTPQPGGTSVPIEGYVTTTSSTTPISFNNSFDLALKITDGATHDSGTLSFTGSLTGSLAATTSSVVASFAPVNSNSVTLDGHTYTVTIPPVSLAPPTSPQENIMASISVTNVSPPSVPPPTSSTPEPTGLLLSSLGITCFGTVCLWKRRLRLPHVLEAA